jgi:ppGpp synthetase/RelA/SpoT-type nucleotidyltranferase
MTTEQPEQQDGNRWVSEYELGQARYMALEMAVVDDLWSVIREHGYIEQVHDIRHRVKKIKSFSEKIARKNYADPLTDMHDLVGVRIVCLYPSILDDIDRIIRETFDVVHYEDKRKGESPELWRYSSIHYDCRVPDTHKGPRYDLIKGIVFEIQLRTILQDAWATVEHKLGYKNEKSIPDELKREFSAMAGLFHIADQRFQYIANEVKRSEQEASNSVGWWVDLYHEAEEALLENPNSDRARAIELQLAELESSADAVIDRGTLKALLRGTYGGRERAKNHQYSELVQELARADVLNLSALRNLLKEGDSKGLTLEQKFPDFATGGRLNDVGFARLVMSVVSPEFRDIRRKRQEGAED